MELKFERGLRNTRVFVTGHSGFTGSWLCAWLGQVGAELFGYALPPEDHEKLFSLSGAGDKVDSVFDDILNFDALSSAMARARPDVVIHLAAQPLVRRSYREPLRTFAVNVMGTANVLEAARNTPSVRGVVAITSDKVYENREWEWAYRENDPLGGKDPYSASKAAAEMVIKGYASSFPGEAGNPYVATARGGNIIGGGDWSEDRLVPDFVRAVASGSTLTLRYPGAIRPWQHVLALVQGYAMLAAGLLSTEPLKFARAWNLGPSETIQYPVRRVIEILTAAWAEPRLVCLDEPLPEAQALALDSRSAHNRLGWTAPWTVDLMIEKTAEWYRIHADRSKSGPLGHGGMRDIVAGQIDEWRAGLAGMA